MQTETERRQGGKAKRKKDKDREVYGSMHEGRKTTMGERQRHQGRVRLPTSDY